MPRRVLLTIDLELLVPHPEMPSAEPFLRVHGDDAPIVAVPLTADGRRVALDAIRRFAELSLKKLEDER